VIIFCSALIVINYLQYCAINSLKQDAFNLNTVTRPTPDKEPPQASTVTVPDKNTSINKQSALPEDSSVSSLPITTSINTPDGELTSTTSVADNAAIPEKTVQITTSIYPAPETAASGTTSLETVPLAIPAKTTNYPFTIQLACYNSLEGAK
jgi:hypothetical protein